jgi:hypothetical protein
MARTSAGPLPLPCRVYHYFPSLPLASVSTLSPASHPLGTRLSRSPHRPHHPPTHTNHSFCRRLSPPAHSSGTPLPRRSAGAGCVLVLRTAGEAGVVGDHGWPGAAAPTACQCLRSFTFRCNFLRNMLLSRRLPSFWGLRLLCRPLTWHHTAAATLCGAAGCWARRSVLSGWLSHAPQGLELLTAAVKLTKQLDKAEQRGMSRDSSARVRSGGATSVPVTVCAAFCPRLAPFSDHQH